MKCVNPRRLPNKGSVNPPFDSYVLVSCGKCYSCLANRRRGWLFRLQNENLDSFLTVFCSFTYDEANRPYDHLVDKVHLQKFFKRLRNFVKFTYYAIGEYGTNTHREHYHAVIFFKELIPLYQLEDYVALIRDLWAVGFVSVSRCTYRRLNYVLHYHTRPKLIDGRPTFQLFSKGLGLSFINTDLVSYLLKSNSRVIHDYNGNSYVIPRYYFKKLKDMLISTPQGLTSLSERFFEPDYHTVDEECLRVFGKHIWQISEKVYVSYLSSKVAVDGRKLVKYNNQDKML